MSTTRRAKPGSSFRQERFASSAALRKGLLGNLVARRCEALSAAADRELIFFLHELSMRNGFAVHRSCNLFPQWPWDSTGASLDSRRAAPASTAPASALCESAFERVARDLTELHPERVTKAVRTARREIAEYLPRLCLDARMEVENASVQGFAGLIQALREYQARFQKAVLSKVATTEVAATIFDALDYCLNQRGMVLVEGTYRCGKSFSAQAWCQMHLGSARYVQLSSATDAGAFFREIARAVGVACSLKMKAVEMRARIEETLRSQQLLLCIDECDWLLPQSIDVRAVPERLSWIMTAMVNQGVAVALIGSRNFTRLLHNVETRCPVWGSEQLHGRIKLRRSLPESLSQPDLFAIARLLLPHADKPTLMLLVGYTMDAQSRVSALENIAGRARFFAERRGRETSFEDVGKAMIEAGYQFAGAAAPTPGETSAERPREVRRRPSRPRPITLSERLAIVSNSG